MFFIIFSMFIVFSIIMLIGSPKKSFFIFLLIIAIIPTGNSYADFISLQGVYYFDFYLIGFFILILKSIMSYSSEKNISIPYSTLFGIFTYLCIILVSVVSNNIVDKYLLKDIRPVIMIFTAVYFSGLVLRIDGYNKNTIFKILFVMFIFSIIHLILPRLGVSVYKDEYYEDNSYRYLDASTYVAAIYIINYFTSNMKNECGKWARLCFYAAILCVLVGNSRFMLLAIFASIIFVSVKDVKKMAIYSLSAILVAGLFLGVSVYVGADRVVNGFSGDVLLFQITNRFSPALSLIDKMSWYNYIFGLGAGTYFDIPWFAYRGLETQNISVDSLYLTMYVKYGLFGLMLIALFTKVAVNGLKANVKKAVIIFCLIMYFVSAIPYHPYSLGIIVGGAVMILLNRKEVV
ncbi:DUF6369 family protein [Klebsiella pneumoniae]|uniref:Serotype K5 polymerase n=4 Tax=Klebsiella pneumoniae TaxID=573 RepID=A2V7R9_KLEPN|nr:DUF6369 family protein [Klebsiella pneumoniae]MEA4450491.1 DUF6369 family protein [Klebsiella pneumoniae]PXI23838.1 hypothetical protein DMP60_06715 [Klebsiella pneumoniae]CZQ24686.1 Uncharacterised protein [Klebsiella pneumoniae]SSK07627.1 Uncharacterised protein [Klebsiella pneumoniae]STS58050.1 Uncharacterised protein [Klebsiella pneumoniae]